MLLPSSPRRPIPAAALLTLLLAAATCEPPAVPVAAASNTAPPGPSAIADSIVVEDSTLLFFVHYRYPQLRDAGPHTDAVNAALTDSARALVAWFRPEAPPEPDFVYQTTVDGSFEVDRLDDRLFSAVETYSYYTGGAHPNSDFVPFNYDLATGRAFVLADLFRPGTPYLDTLSARTEAYLEAWADPYGLGEGAYWEEGYAPESINFARFTVGADSLHLYFPPYQLAAYAAGPFEIAVPLDALRPLLAADGPAAALAR